MYKVALIDDTESEYENYRYRLNLEDIDLVFMKHKQDENRIIDWLLDEQIEFVLVDYKLDLMYEFKGSHLIQTINNAIPDLQCLLLTSYIANDDLVMDRLKVEKEVFNSHEEDYVNFVNTIKQGANVYKNRRKRTLEEYEKLKYKKDSLTAIEEEKMRKYYRELISFGMVEEVPRGFFDSKLEEKMDKVIEVVGKYIYERNDK